MGALSTLSKPKPNDTRQHRTPARRAVSRSTFESPTSSVWPADVPAAVIIACSARGLRLAAQRVVAADDLVEERRPAERLDDARGVVQRLVRQHGDAGAAARGLDRRLHARVRLRVNEQAGIVNLQEARQRVARIDEPRRREGAIHQHARAVADHPPHRVLRQRPAAEPGDQLVRRIREVAAGVDERAVEIEGDQAL